MWGWRAPKHTHQHQRSQFNFQHVFPGFLPCFLQVSLVGCWGGSAGTFWEPARGPGARPRAAPPASGGRTRSRVTLVKCLSGYYVDLPKYPCGCEYGLEPFSFYNLQQTPVLKSHDGSFWPEMVAFRGKNNRIERLQWHEQNCLSFWFDWKIIFQILGSYCSHILNIITYFEPKGP